MNGIDQREEALKKCEILLDNGVILKAVLSERTIRELMTNLPYLRIKTIWVRSRHIVSIIELDEV
jgi:hypothetical protein